MQNLSLHVYKTIGFFPIRIFFLLLLGVLFFRYFPLQENQHNTVFAAKSSKKNQDRAPNGMNFLTTTSLELDGGSLYSFLEKFAELYEFSYFIDRRIDPSTKISGSFSNEPFISILDQVLEENNMSYCVVNNSFLYIGPEDAAGEALLLLGLKRQDMEEYPRQVQEKLNSAFDFKIDAYTESREVFSALAKRSRLRMDELDSVPFDRWREASFKHIVATDMFSILCLGFNIDYRYDVDSGTIKPTSLDRRKKVSRYYPQSFSSKLDREKYPKCSFSETTLEGEKVDRVSGRFADMVAIELEIARLKRANWSAEAKEAQDPDLTQGKLRAAKKKKSGTDSHIEVSGSIKNKTLRDVFSFLKKNSGITCSLDPLLKSSDVSLDSRISCEFKNADVDEIADVIAKEIGARSRVTGNTILFVPKSK